MIVLMFHFDVALFVGDWLCVYIAGVLLFGAARFVVCGCVVSVLGGWMLVCAGCLQVVWFGGFVVGNLWAS